jgi:IstB-like ATP binding protein
MSRCLQSSPTCSATSGPIPTTSASLALPHVTLEEDHAALRRKSHLAAALGLALVRHGRRVLFIRTTDLVQRLQVARRELGLEAAITKLDKYQLLILDDIAYVS